MHGLTHAFRFVVRWLVLLCSCIQKVVHYRYLRLLRNGRCMYYLTTDPYQKAIKRLKPLHLLTSKEQSGTMVHCSLLCRKLFVVLPVVPTCIYLKSSDLHVHHPASYRIANGKSILSPQLYRALKPSYTSTHTTDNDNNSNNNHNHNHNHKSNNN